MPFSRTSPEASPRILVIGDSSAVGVGAGEPGDSVAGRLAADYPNAEVVNQGVNGARTRDLIDRLRGISAERFDLIVIQIGGNDIVRLANVQRLGRDLEVVLDLAVGISDNVVLMTSGNVGTAKLFPPGIRWLHEQRTRAVREKFKGTATAKGVAYVDLFREASDDPFARDPKRYYAADFFHPSSDGYADWYRFLVPIVRSTTFDS